MLVSAGVESQYAITPTARRSRRIKRSRMMCGRRTLVVVSTYLRAAATDFETCISTRHFEVARNISRRIAMYVLHNHYFRDRLGAIVGTRIGPLPRHSMSASSRRILLGTLSNFIQTAGIVRFPYLFAADAHLTQLIRTLPWQLSSSAP